MLCVLCLIVLWGFSLVSSYSGVNNRFASAITIQKNASDAASDAPHLLLKGVRCLAQGGDLLFKLRDRDLHSDQALSQWV